MERTYFRCQHDVWWWLCAQEPCMEKYAGEDRPGVIGQKVLVSGKPERFVENPRGRTETNREW